MTNPFSMSCFTCEIKFLYDVIVCLQHGCETTKKEELTFF